MADSRTILLVEDEALIALSEAAMLRREGYTVRLAYNADEAIANVRAQPQAIDLILMDINLGRGMDGTQAAQEILKEHDIPIIFLSSHTEPEVVEKTEKITSYGYVVKNCGSTVLSASIKMAFRLHAAHQALRRTNEMLSQAQEASRAGTWEWDITGKSFSWSPEFLQVFGLPPEIKPDLDALFRVVHPEDRDIFMENIQEVLRNETRQYCDFRILLPGGEIRWISTTGKIYNDGYRPLRMTGLCMDITERKQAEKALAHSHALMQYVIEHSRSAIAVHDRDMNYIYVSQRYLDEYKIKEKDIIGKHHYEVFPDLPEKWRTVHQRVLAGEVLSGEDDPYERADGSVDWTRWECRPWYEDDGSIGGLIVYTEVITERKRIEAHLKKSEARLREAQRIAGFGDWEWDAQMDQVNWSQELYALAQVDKNLPPPSFEGYTRLCTQESMSRLQVAAEQALQTGKPVELDLEIVCGDGSSKWLSVRGEVLHDTRGQRIGLRGTAFDITARKQAEEALKLKTAEVEIFFSNALDLLCIANTDGQFVRLNREWSKVLGYPLEELEGRKFLDFVHPDDLASTLTATADLREQRTVLDFTNRYRCKDGSYRWIEWRSTPEANRIYAAARDITAHKQAEEALRRSLHEKEVLMHELQHRVKNTLAVAASLLGLEEGRLPDEHTRAIFANVQSRLHTMSAVYEQLYRGGGVDQIHLRHYLQQLIDALAQSYLPQTGQVCMETEMDDLQLDLKRTLPLGIILNELITNALKYAFPGGKTWCGGTATIRVVLAQAEGQVHLWVIDNGVGMTAKTGPRSDGIGLDLVRMLAQQIDGNFTIDGSQGCSACIAFRLT